MSVLVLLYHLGQIGSSLYLNYILNYLYLIQLTDVCTWYSLELQMIGEKQNVNNILILWGRNKKKGFVKQIRIKLLSGLNFIEYAGSLPAGTRILGQK